MSNRIEFATAQMILVALQQQESTFRGKPEHAGLVVARDMVARFCAIPLANAVIAQARGVTPAESTAPVAVASPSVRRLARNKHA
jgi:hypothetical protein